MFYSYLTWNPYCLAISFFDVVSALYEKLTYATLKETCLFGTLHI